ncbi:MAG: hypothetical protein KGO02_10160, partial [Alphaproteobacteria bacterium]|nr:hypothetical protein [Alphaproteobacteria bacterium]
MLRWIAIAALGFGLAGPACASGVTITTADGYGRLLFTGEHPVASEAAGVLVLRFAKRPPFTADAIMHGLAGYISDGHAGPDGKTFRFALAIPVWLHQTSAGNRFAIDLVPASYPGTPPSLPPPAPPPQAKPLDISTLPVLKIRAGAYAHFTRLVFAFHAPIAYSVFPGDGRITIHFDAKLRPDFKALEAVAPPWVKEAGWHVDSTGTVIDFNTLSQSGYHDFRDGQNVVLDILAPRTDAQSYDPPGAKVGRAQADIRWLRPDLAHGSESNAAQQAAVLSAAAAVDGKLAQASALPVPSPRPHRTVLAATPDGAVPVAASASAATLRFPASAAMAAFVSGRNAWIVLSPAKPLPVAFLRKGLGDFSSDVAVSSQNGVSIVRIALRTHEEMRVRSEGATNVVQIAPHFVSASDARPLTITRDIDTPDVAALRVGLPGAQSAVQLGDPASGGSLTVVPAAPGRVLGQVHRYVDFAALPSAAGLVLRPFADDLEVESSGDHVRIARPGGLRLTAAEIPAVMSPVALTALKDGPTYINFADWS